MKVSIKLDIPNIRRIEKAAKDSAVPAMEAVQADLVSMETMPFDTGDMQNNQTFVETAENGAVLITGSPQARRLYYHPEYNFQRGKNANAGAYWLQDYLTGERKDFPAEAFTKIFKEKSGI